MVSPRKGGASSNQQEHINQSAFIANPREQQAPQRMARVLRGGSVPNHYGPARGSVFALAGFFVFQAFFALKRIDAGLRRGGIGSGGRQLQIGLEGFDRPRRRLH